MKKILTSEQDQWLMDNFRDKSNAQLTKELNEILYRQYEKKLEILRMQLQSTTTINQKLRILKEIKNLRSFQGLKPHYIKNYARRLGCGKMENFADSVRW